MTCSFVASKNSFRIHLPNATQLSQDGSKCAFGLLAQELICLPLRASFERFKFVLADKEVPEGHIYVF